MREIRMSGSEGGGGREASPYPYSRRDASVPLLTKRLWLKLVCTGRRRLYGRPSAEDRQVATFIATYTYLYSMTDINGYK
jgi:hypothetical protein